MRRLTLTKSPGIPHLAALRRLVTSEPLKDALITVGGRFETMREISY